MDVDATRNEGSADYVDVVVRVGVLRVDRWRLGEANEAVGCVNGDCGDSKEERDTLCRFR